MFFQHIYEKSLAQGSYFIGCQATGEAMVIDPQRDIDVYLEIAQQNKMRIKYIAETHIHADFLCGSRELAAATGGILCLSDEGGPDWQYEFPHEGLRDNDVLEVGNLSFKIMHTPGHTPESISFILTDHPSSDAPVMIFTGDFVFVGDIGRPDLLEEAAGISGTKEPAARQMFQSLQKFAALPDYLQVWPAHGAGSSCGKALGAVASSTLGYEKLRNWALQYGADVEGFVRELLQGQPEPPKYFAMMKKLNKTFRPLLVEVPRYPILSQDQFWSAYNKGIKIIDTRDKVSFAKAHIPKSINIQGNNSFSTWAGWLVNYQEQIVVIADEPKIEAITRQLMRIGLDNVYGFVTDINALGISTLPVYNIGFEEFRTAIQNPEVQIVDVRNQSEFSAGHVKGADHVFLGTLEENLDKVSRTRPVVVHCQAGDRSSIAFSLLAKHGFYNVQNYTGGMKEWKENNGPVAVGSSEMVNA